MTSHMNHQIITLAQSTLKALNTHDSITDFEARLAHPSIGPRHLQTALDMVNLVLKDGNLPEHQQKKIQNLQEDIIYTIQQKPSPFMTRAALQDIMDILNTLTVTVTSDLLDQLTRMKAERFLGSSSTLSSYNMGVDENGVLYAHLHFKGHNVNTLPEQKNGEGFLDVFLKDDAALTYKIHRINIVLDPTTGNLYFNGHLADEYVFIHLIQDFQIAI